MRNILIFIFRLRLEGRRSPSPWDLIIGENVFLHIVNPALGEGLLMIWDGILERILFRFSINRTIMVTILHNKLIKSINNWKLFFLLILFCCPLMLFTFYRLDPNIVSRGLWNFFLSKQIFHFVWPLLRLKHELKFCNEHLW